MRVEEAITHLRMGAVVRCKRRMYAVDGDGVLYRVFVPEGGLVAKIYGEATISGQDFMTDDWELTGYMFDRGVV